MRDFAVFIPIFALMIPIVAILARTATKWMALREKQLEQQSTMTAEKAAQYAAHTERLEQRVRVLERIATDKGVDVAAEIEALRDERPLN
ncbi:MAG: hypothetical protein H2056_03910 [Sphingopyxis sp.]|nr:hypothetical protein [Sphingopyxis sp.]